MKLLLLLWLAAGGLSAIEPGTNAPPRENLQITADTFEFDSANSIAVYSNNVVVIDPPSKPGQTTNIITCQLLTVKLPKSGGKIEHIVAEKDVFIHQGSNYATGAKAVYKSETDIIELTGEPMLVTGQATLWADTVIYDRIKNTLHARGRARMEINQNAVGFKSSPTNKPAEKK